MENTIENTLKKTLCGNNDRQYNWIRFTGC